MDRHGQPTAQGRAASGSSASATTAHGSCSKGLTARRTRCRSTSGSTPRCAGDRARLGQLQIELENQLTPREIQARIRAGQTAEEIALSAQVPVERVRRFEGPVIQERWHIADLAQSTNVRRVTDSSAHPLSDLVLERLAARGVEPDDMSWDARRREDGRWAVRLDYLHGGRERSATWLFDHQRRTLEPHDEEAGWLTADERAVPEPARSQRGRSKPAVPPPPAPVEEPEPVPSPPRLSAVPDVDEAPDRWRTRRSTPSRTPTSTSTSRTTSQTWTPSTSRPANPMVLCGRPQGHARRGRGSGRRSRAGTRSSSADRQHPRTRGSLPQGHGPTRVADPVAPRPGVQRGRDAVASEGGDEDGGRDA